MESLKWKNHFKAWRRTERERERERKREKTKRKRQGNKQGPRHLRRCVKNKRKERNEARSGVTTFGFTYKNVDHFMNKSLACILQESSLCSGLSQFRKNTFLKKGVQITQWLKLSASSQSSSQLPIRSFFTGTDGSSVPDHWIFNGGWLWECQRGLPGTALTKDFGGRSEHLGAIWGYLFRSTKSSPPVFGVHEIANRYRFWKSTEHML